ncbi:MAG: hypothetical protein KAS32_19720 [Candidatus Peribacteraceae bacterium]|nr:hypothetical protein [Candidatus Peribacteraceae bacterium]
MPSTKVFGVIRGSGTKIIEKPAQRQIIPSPFGVTAWIGILEKGPTNEIIEVNSMSDFERRCGLRTPDSEMHINADDFWDSSKGRGKQFHLRVTDGTERKAARTFKTQEDRQRGALLRWRDALTVTAKNGGRWAGAYNRRIGEHTGAGDLSATTVDTGLTLLLDEFAGGTIIVDDAGTYNIIGNTVAGIVTVQSDADVLTDWGAGPALEFILFKNNEDTYGNTKALQILYKDGARDPVNEFGMEAYLNGNKIIDYPDLSLDPASSVYATQLINNDVSNFEFTVTVDHTGAITAYTRPANQSGECQTANLAATVLTLDWFHEYYVTALTADTTIGTFTPGANLQREVLTITCSVPATTWTVESSAQEAGTLEDATEAVIYAADNAYTTGFTIAAGAIPSVVGDQIIVVIEPVISGEPDGGRLYYNTADLPNSFLEIYSSTPTTVSVRPGNDLTSLTADTKPYRLEYPETLEDGYDGASGVVDNDYIAALDLNTSLFNRMARKRLGLIKFACPGVNSTVTQKAVRSYAAANNGMYRGEVTKTIITETEALAYVETTMGRNDYQEFIWPSYYLREDPDGTGLITICNTGMIQGVESDFANTYEGYHRAAAGSAAVLERIIQLPTKDLIIDNENTNPRGLQVILVEEGNFVIWGDSIPATSTGIFWKHKREQLSHYERVLIENFNYIIFGLNDAEERDPLISVMKAYFRPEWQPKRAIRGNTLNDAARIQADQGNNTDATMATGDLNMEITLRLADVIDKFKITISQAGITETTP